MNKTITTIIILLFGAVLTFADVNTVDPDGAGPLPDYLILDNGSCLGIGLDNPDGPLSITGSNDEIKLHIANTNLGGYSVIRMGESNTGFGKGYLHRFNSGWITNGAWETSSLAFYESVGAMNLGANTNVKIFTNGISTAHERLRVTSEGHVGIGTPNPDGILSIVGSSEAEVKLHLANTNPGGYSVIRMGESNTGFGKGYLHRFNNGWATHGAWEASSLAFYESVGAMNLGANTNFKIFTNGITAEHERLRVTNEGNVGIGTTEPTEKLDVAGTIKATEFKAPLDNWADYVFEPGYKLMPLEKLEKFTKKKKHLPGIPSEKQLKKKGLSIGKIQKMQMEKIEELVLYVIELNNENKELRKELIGQKKQIMAQNKQIITQNKRIKRLEKKIK
ncbi:hypothetical protein ACFL2K_00705 [Candidatus Margulisiibacteriota bacterium]